ncbi:MAG: hypothetical protein HC867_06525 [Bacteroidia bacterium]|nr:hypothetical protein [Bacteroidia bacterium]
MNLLHRIQILILVSIVTISCSYYDNFLFIKTLKKAIEHKKNERYTEALSEISRAIKLSPTSTKALVLRGIFIMILKCMIKPWKILLQQKKLDNKSVSVNFYKGITYYALEKLDSSVEAYNKAIQIKGSDTLYLEMNPEGLESELLGNDINMDVIRYYRGLSYYQRKEDIKALTDFLFCVNHNFNLGNSLFYSGAIYLSLGQNSRGCQFLYKALSLGAEDAKGYLEKYCK